MVNYWKKGRRQTLLEILQGHRREVWVFHSAQLLLELLEAAMDISYLLVRHYFKV